MFEADYKFYLAFENVNCKEYITEEFYKNALSYNILPIVMGARPQDYKQNAPLHSYIHVEDFKSAMNLAQYLNELDEDDSMYNMYFAWKGTGELIDTKLWCRICAMLHDDNAISNGAWYSDINEWIHQPNICTDGFWHDVRKQTNVEI